MPAVLQGNTAAAAPTSQGVECGQYLQTFYRECGDRPPDGVLAMDWLKDVYHQVWGAAPWPFLRQEVLLSTVAPITSDSVTVTNGSATVTETTSNSKWTTAVIGRKFRKTGDTPYYTITGYANANPDTLTLDRVYEGTTATVSGYEIFQDTYTISTQVGAILGVTDIATGYELTEASAADADLGFPSRAVKGTPKVYMKRGRDSNDIYQIQLIPYPDAAKGYVVRYVQAIPTLDSVDDTIVPFVWSGLLKNGWLARYWRWRARMDDATGTEFQWQAQYDLLFQQELNEMVVREYRNEAPQVMRLARRFTMHRAIRNRPYKYGMHSSEEMP